MDALRVADGALMTTEEIAGRIIEAKGFDAADAVLRKAISEQALALLRSFRNAARSTDRIGARTALEIGERGLAPRPPFAILKVQTNCQGSETHGHEQI